MDNTYSIEYAKSGRSKCRKCKEPIVKGDLRIVTTIPGEDFETKQNHHHTCFKLPRKLAVKGPHQTTAADFVRTLLCDETGGEILPACADEIVAAMEKQATTPKKKLAGGGGENDDYVGALKRAYEDGGETTDGKNTKRFKPAEMEAYGFYAKHKNDELKDVLRWNKQQVTGSKPILLGRILDGHLRGRLARCTVCEGGRLKLLDDGVTVCCGGTFDEDSRVRIECSYKITVKEAPRWQPWYSVEPSEAEKEAMDNQVEAAMGKVPASDSKQKDVEGFIKEKAAKFEWDLASKKGLQAAASAFIALLRDNEVDLPSDDVDAKRKLGPIIASNRGMTAVEIVPLLLKEFGFAADKKTKAEKKQAAVEKSVKHAGNAQLVAAFKELSKLYFQAGNSNAGSTYNKVAAAVSGFDFEVTQENALGLGKGKTKMPGIGKATAEKMQEFVSTGKMQKLEDKRLEMA